MVGIKPSSHPRASRTYHESPELVAADINAEDTSGVLVVGYRAKANPIQDRRMWIARTANASAETKANPNRPSRPSMTCGGIN